MISCYSLETLIMYPLYDISLVLNHQYLDVEAKVNALMPGDANEFYIIDMLKLIHCGLVTLYGDIDLGQHWFTKWLVTWLHQAIF